MDTKELIDSIIASEDDSAEKFVSTMEERISDALEVRKVELASGMMGDLDEATVGRLASYEKKARNDKSEAEWTAAVDHPRNKDSYEGEDPERDRLERRAEKRGRGIELARAKMNKSGKSGNTTAKVRAVRDPRAQVKPRIKEEVEQVDEADDKELAQKHKYWKAYAFKTTKEVPGYNAPGKDVYGREYKPKNEEVDQDLDEAKFVSRAQWRTETPGIVLKSYEGTYKKYQKTDPEKAKRFYNNYIKPHLERHPELAKEEFEQVDEVAKWRNPPRSAVSSWLGRGFKYSPSRARGAYVNPIDNAPEDKLAARQRAKERGAKQMGEELKREFDPKDEYDRDQNHPNSYNLRAPEELRKNPKFGGPSPTSRAIQRIRASNNAKMNAKLPEEVEQIDELKKSTLASYVGKSAGRIRAATSLSHDFGRMADTAKKAKNRKAARDLQIDFEKKAANRVTGVRRAAARLAKEDVEQIDEVSAGKYAAVAAARGNEWDADVNYEKSNYNPKKLKDVVRRAGKKFGPKVASQLSTMQGTREKRMDARGARGNDPDRLAKPYPSYDGPRTTKSGMLNKTAGRILKKQIRDRLNKEEVEQMDEADKLAGLDYNKGHKLMYKGGKQKIVKTAGSQQAHRAMGWKERHSVRAAMKEDLVNEAGLSDMQKLTAMKATNKGATITALARFQKAGGDINKLSPAHRTLVSNYMQKAGGVGGLSRSMQMMALKPKSTHSKDDGHGHDDLGAREGMRGKKNDMIGGGPSKKPAQK